MKRFDRQIFDGKPERIHMVSASSMQEQSFRNSFLSYSLLLKLCQILTRDEREVWKLFRLACFNAFTHNMDDHGKNFSFLYDHYQNCWKFAPAYDLTCSTSAMGEHSTAFFGNSKTPGKKEFLHAANSVGFNLRKAERVIDEIQKTVEQQLKKWLDHPEASSKA